MPKKLVYHQSLNSEFLVEYGVNTYNGYTIEEIESMPFKGWAECHVKEYIRNCKEVIDIQMSGVNLNTIWGIKNYNFNLVQFYLKHNDNR